MPARSPRPAGNGALRCEMPGTRPGMTHTQLKRSLCSRFRGVVVLGLFAAHDLVGEQACILPDGSFDRTGNVGVALEKGFRVLATLADALAVVGEPGAGLFDHAGLDAEIDQLAHLGDALAVHDVELYLLERRR